MSRASLQDIQNLGRRLTTEEERYLQARSRGWEIEVNHRQHPKKDDALIPSDDEEFVLTVGDDDDEAEDAQLAAGDDVADDATAKYEQALVAQVKGLSVKDLKAELQERTIIYSRSDLKKDLQLKLLEAVSNEA
jgi:hypothetical protein